jgi:hypothetical protein
MKRKQLWLLVALLTGCASPSERMRVGITDPTPRLANTGAFEIFRGGQMPLQPYTEIAAFTLDGNSKDEAEAVGAMAQKARALGADGLILGHTDKPFQGAFVPPIAWRAQGKRTFNASAFVYNKHP